MSDAVLVASVAATSSVLAALATAGIASWTARKSAAGATRIDEIGLAVAGMEKLLNSQERRIEALERELSTVKEALLVEQRQHATTRELLRIAMRHIRDMLSWLGGDRQQDPPTVPDELTHQL